MKPNFKDQIWFKDTYYQSFMQPGPSEGVPDITGFNFVAKWIKMRAELAMQSDSSVMYMSKSDAPGILCGTLVDNPVKDKETSMPCVTASNIKGTQVLMLDIDKVDSDITWERLVKMFREDFPCRWVMYTSPSSSDEPGKLKVRLVMPLSRFITSKEKHDLQFRIEYFGLDDHGFDIDPASFQPAQFFLLPCLVAGKTDPKEIHYYSNITDSYLDVDSLPPVDEDRKAKQQAVYSMHHSVDLSEVRSPEKIIAKMEALQEGERDNGFFRICASLKAAGLSYQNALDLIGMAKITDDARTIATKKCTRVWNKY